MKPVRPTPLTVLAIFHFIFGGLGLVCGLFGLVGQAAGINKLGGGSAAQTADQKEAQDLQKKIEDAMEQKSPWYKQRQPLMVGLSLSLSVLLLVGGLGMWNLSSWARPVSFVYAALSLTHSLISLIFLLAYDWPIANHVMESTQVKGQQAQLVKQVFPYTMYGAIGLIFLMMLYPVITVIVMLLPSTARAFSGTSAGEDSPGDRDDVPDYDDRPWRERENQGGEGFTPK